MSSVEDRLLGDIRAQVDAAADAAEEAVRAGLPVTGSGSAGMMVQVAGPDGKVVAPNLPAGAVACEPGGTAQCVTYPAFVLGVPIDARTGGPSYETTLDGVEYAVAAREVDGPNGSFSVAVALPLGDIELTVAALKDRLAVGIPVLVVLAAVTAWILASRVLRPIERMRLEAETITATTNDRRLATPQSRDEVARLADTMNRMLDRLENASQRQRQFISDASHELRSPLATLQADLEIGLKEPESADWPVIAGDALRDAAELNALIDNLLDLARLEEQRPDGGRPNREVERAAEWASASRSSGESSKPTMGRSP